MSTMPVRSKRPPFCGVNKPSTGRIRLPAPVLILALVPALLLAACEPNTGGADGGLRDDDPPPAWRTETVDGFGNDYVGRSSALAVDADGVLHVAYYDTVWGDLKYARGKWLFNCACGEVD